MVIMLFRWIDYSPTLDTTLDDTILLITVYALMTPETIPLLLASADI